MEVSIWHYFTDAVLRAPTIGSMLMGLSAGIIGVFTVLRREALIGEVLSHAAYPGIIIGMATVVADGEIAILAALLGGIVTALLGIGVIRRLERSFQIPSDAALCFVLAATFGIGVVIISHLQFSDPILYRRTLSLLYGQAATMTDFYLYVYGVLAGIAILTVFFLYKEIQLIIFDRCYATTLGIAVPAIEALLFTILALTVIVGVRTVGVVLMSAMLIAPPLAARQFTDRLGCLFFLSALFGAASAFAGNYLSAEVSNTLASLYPKSRLALPTGPTIALIATMWCILALLLAPRRGLIARQWRRYKLRRSDLEDNILKLLWRSSSHITTRKVLYNYLRVSYLTIRRSLKTLKRRRYIVIEKGGNISLTCEGTIRAIAVASQPPSRI